MLISEFLRTPVLDLPRKRTVDDYEVFLENWFEEYLSALTGLEGGDLVIEELRSNRDVVNQLCTAIRSAMHEYFLGYPARAYLVLSGALNSTLPWLWKLGTKTDVSHHLTYLYRIRMGGPAEYDRPDLFHIPFEKRHLVKSQRFSIPGLPSLYLGGSTWLCWEEMSRPAFDTIQVSRFSAIPDSNVRVLDLAYRPEVIAQFAELLRKDLNEPNPNSDFIVSHAICWPLVAACSVQVRHRGSPFVPEYVIPQLLLQWIRGEEHFEGIRYFSTRIAHKQDDDGPDQIQAAANAEANYVFPVVSQSGSGQCSKLSSQFELSAPVAWPIASDLSQTRQPPTGGFWFLKVGESPVVYYSTSFYKVEIKLNALKLGKVWEGCS